MDIRHTLRCPVHSQVFSICWFSKFFCIYLCISTCISKSFVFSVHLTDEAYEFFRIKSLFENCIFLYPWTTIFKNIANLFAVFTKRTRKVRLGVSIRITECLGLEGMLQFQSTCNVQGHLSLDQASQSSILPCLEHLQGCSIHSLLCKLFQCITNIIVKNFLSLL